MYSIAMLTKVVKTGPYLILSRAIMCSAPKASVSAVFWCDLVDTFHVSFCIIVSTEGFGAVLALVRLAVT